MFSLHLIMRKNKNNTKGNCRMFFRIKKKNLNKYDLLYALFKVVERNRNQLVLKKLRQKLFNQLLIIKFDCYLF